MTDYEKDFYKNWNNIKFLKDSAGNNLIVLSNKIKKTSADGPYIDGHIAEFIFEINKSKILSNEEINERVKLAIFYIRKGNEKNIIEILNKKF
jgi:hypothetical protein